MNGVFFYFSPEKIVSTLGVENSYFVVFSIAAIGGLSSVTSAVLYSSIASFAAGGATPWLLGIAGGIGIAIGDAIIFTLLRYGYTNFIDNTKEHKTLARIQERIKRTPPAVPYVILYLILGFTPTPNDIILALLTPLHYKLRTLFPILLLSGITIATITAYSGKSLLELLFS